MLAALFGQDWQRRRLLHRAAPGPLADFLRRPLPDRRGDYRNCEYLALDFETTGLDATHDHILSMGWVVVQGQRVDLATATHLVIRTSREIPEQSAVLHRITDERAAAGLPLSQALPILLEALQGRALIAHNARIELAFLNRVCRDLYGSGMVAATVDTQNLAAAWFRRRDLPIRSGELRLDALRGRFNLPRYAAHNALSDAVAAAELFLALASYRDTGTGMRLAEFLS